MPLHPQRFTYQSHDGLAINGWDYGSDGQPLLLSHCTGALARQWDPIIERLGGAFHCYAIDTRGHGDSDSPRDDDGYLWRNSGQDLLGIIDMLGLDRPFAVGHSAGGAQVAFAERQRPGAFERVALLDAIVGPDIVHEQGKRLADNVSNRVNTFANREEARERLASKPPIERWHPEMLEAYLQHAFQETPEGVTLKCPGEREARFYLSSQVTALFESLDQISVHALLITGEKSGVRPLIETQHTLLPQAELEVLPGTTHFIPQEKPDEVAERLSNWFKESTRSR